MATVLSQRLCSHCLRHPSKRRCEASTSAAIGPGTYHVFHEHSTSLRHCTRATLWMLCPRAATRPWWDQDTYQARQTLVTRARQEVAVDMSPDRTLAHTLCATQHKKGQTFPAFTLFRMSSSFACLLVLVIPLSLAAYCFSFPERCGIVLRLQDLFKLLTRMSKLY